MKALTNENLEFLRTISERGEKIVKTLKEKGYNCYVSLEIGISDCVTTSVRIGDEKLVGDCILRIFNEEQQPKVLDCLAKMEEYYACDADEMRLKLYQSKIDAIKSGKAAREE